MSGSPHCRAFLTVSQQVQPITDGSMQQTSDEHDLFSSAVLCFELKGRQNLYPVEKKVYFLIFSTVVIPDSVWWGKKPVRSYSFYSSAFSFLDRKPHGVNWFLWIQAVFFCHLCSTYVMYKPRNSLYILIGRQKILFILIP